MQIEKTIYKLGKYIGITSDDTKGDSSAQWYLTCVFNKALPLLEVYRSMNNSKTSGRALAISLWGIREGDWKHSFTTSCWIVAPHQMH